MMSFEDLAIRIMATLRRKDFNTGSDGVNIDVER
jgi:hypothetical protein